MNKKRGMKGEKFHVRRPQKGGGRMFHTRACVRIKITARKKPSHDARRDEGEGETLFYVCRSANTRPKQYRHDPRGVQNSWVGLYYWQMPGLLSTLIGAFSMSSYSAPLFFFFFPFFLTFFEHNVIRLQGFSVFLCW